jgi:hypothetical protein
MEWLNHYSACMHIRTCALFICIYAYAYMCMKASAIVSSYLLFPLQIPLIKSSYTELIDLSDHKNVQ